MAEYERRRREFTEERTTEKAIRKFVELKTGRELAFPLLADLPRLWEGINRRRAPSPHYTQACRSILERFGAFVKKAQPDAVELVSVTPETAAAFFDAENERGVSPTTWNYSLKILRSTFRRLHPQLTDASNPFRDFITKEKQTVGRQPFTPDELRDIVEVGATEPFIRPILITGMCTAMRRGDCCMLKWADVDLAEGFLAVKTAKTGERVDIPIFPMLAEELKKARAAATDSRFCFPAQAQMYQTNPDGITRRVKLVLARALEVKQGRAGEAQSILSTEEARSRGLAYLDGLRASVKTGRMRQVLLAYLEGKAIDDVMAATGCGRGTVSAYLNEIQAAMSGRFIRGNARAVNLSQLQVARPSGLRRASVRDFHSFRVTWITLALAAGVPLELVQRVTGHRTVEVVMKHYFRPGREDFRSAILKAMPKMLSNAGEKRSVNLEILEILDGMTARSWRVDRERMLRILKTAVS